MDCPKCQFKNGEAAKFCVECGNKLEIKCSTCGYINPPESKFCGECGSELGAPSEKILREIAFNGSLTKIQKYLPRGLSEKILSQKDKIEGERKHVTVMFCEMEGFAALSDILGSEETYRILNQVYEILIHKVHDYEGIVNEMTGNGILALYGAPIALEDAPQRAIRSSLSIHREMAKFNDRIKQDKDIKSPIKIKIGIHTGPVVVGSLGNDLRVEFKAVGNTVNLASRMESLAEAGTTCVTKDTFKLTEGFFRFESLGPQQVKGKQGQIWVYQVIAPSSRRTRFDVSAEQGLTPFVGRDREMELLLDGFARAKEGRGEAFFIIGEAGVGKSRFLYEFRKAVAHEDITFLEGKCLSYGRSAAYHPIIDILKSNFDIRDDDEDFEIRRKVEKSIAVLGGEQASTLPYFLELLSVKDSGVDKISMSPESRKDRILGALKQIVLKGSGIRPLVMAIEDLHWVDKSSEDALKYLLDSIPAARVLLILTYRPGFVHPWGGRSYHNQTTLNRLSTRESQSVVAHLLGTQEVDKDVERLIQDKTDGVPFFIEELLKSMKDLKIIEKKNGKYELTKNIQAVAIPSTIQDMIMARVDSLPDTTKAVLQYGSVIEREFTHELIKGAIGIDKQKLLDHLRVLKDSELLFERGIYPDSTYIFKHALTRDVVYDSILMKKRKQLHEEIGNAIEELYRPKIDEHYGNLINHFQISENYRKVADYSRLACKKAENALILHDATDYAKKWIVALETMPQTGELQDEIIDARTDLGFFLFQMSNMAEAKESIDPIVETVLKKNLKNKYGQVCIIIGSYKYMVEENLAESMQYLEEAIKISQEADDLITSAYAQYMLGLVLSFNCEFEKAIHYFGTLLNLSIALEFPWRISAMKSNLSVYGYDYHGLVAQGYQTSEDAIRIAEDSGDIYSKAMAYASHGASCYHKGFFKEAKKYLNTGIDFTARIKMFAHNAMAHQYLAHCYFDLKNYEKAQHHYCRAIQVREHSRLFPSSANLNRIALTRAKLLGGEKDINLELLYQYVRQNRVRIYNGCMARYIGDILLHLDECHLTAAEEWIAKAIEADKRNGMRCDLGWDYALYGEFFKAKGEPSKAKQFLGKAIEIFKACGADGWVRKAEETLEQI
jgi:class 3 adenylate cyclase/tetratricopeptide (TPR) repeat protein